ncbi:MAG TPA: SMP-30/gluconolactonase/LRE family protein [Thermomicrobiales bacterium]|nr:SMP-30/gluconolactonase/LRE family protein [Thermomicrobiales bacterium]
MSCSLSVRAAVACRPAAFALIVAACWPTASHAGDELMYPLAIAAKDDQTIFLADRELPGVWRADGGRLKILFRGEKKFRTPLNAPRSLAIDREGRLLAGDSATREVYRFDAAGKPEPLTGGEIGIPMGIAVNRAGDLLVSDLELHTIWKVPAAGGKPSEFARIAGPAGVCIDAEDRLWVVSRAENALLRASPDGAVTTIVKGRAFQFPHAVVVDKASTAYVCDGYAKTIWKVEAEGKPQKWATSPALVNPVGLAWQGETLLVVDSRAKAVFQVNSEGKVAPFELKPE